jgi:hypothetical protein
MIVFDSNQCINIVQEFDAFENKHNEDGLEFYKNSVGAYDLPATLQHVENLTTEIQKKFPGAVFKNSYTRAYHKDSFLKIHTDREGLDITLSVCLEKKIPAAYPLYVSQATYEGVWSADVETTQYTKNFKAYDMPVGVGSLVEGRKYPHWRDPLDCEEGERAVYVFYHWEYQKKKPLLAPSFVLKNPNVALYNNFLSAAECAVLVWMSADKVKRSTVVNDATGEGYIDPNRTSSGTSFTIGENELVSRIEQKISNLTGYPIENGEGLQVFKYEEGQEYKPHFDYFDTNSPGVANEAKNNRICTFIMYLNTPEEGGATIFPDAGITVSAIQGSALQFSYPNAAPESKTLHAGSPVIKGTKWIATKWIRKNEYK